MTTWLDDLLGYRRIAADALDPVLRRGQLRVKAGAGVSLTLADDAINGETSLTIAASGGGGGDSVLVGPLTYTTNASGQLVYQADLSQLAASPTQNGIVVEVTACLTRGNYAVLTKRFASFRKTSENLLGLVAQGDVTSGNWDGTPVGSLSWVVTDEPNFLAQLQFTPGGSGNSEVTARLVFTPALA